MIENINILYSKNENNDNDNKKEKMIKKLNCYRSLFFLTLIILWNLCVFTSYKKSENNSRYNSLIKGLVYIQNCFDGVFLNNNTNFLVSEPKISVVISVYNCENTIIAAVRSIQNQNMANIEIILVNDFSKDNTSKIIQKLSAEDPRIKIIKMLIIRKIWVLYIKEILEY